MTAQTGYFGRFARRGLKTGAILGVLQAARLTAAQPLLLVISLLTGLVDGLAVKALLRIVPEPDYPEAGYPILSSLLIGACSFAVNAALFGLIFDQLLGEFVVFVLALACAAIAVVAGQDILTRRPALHQRL